MPDNEKLKPGAEDFEKRFQGALDCINGRQHLKDLPPNVVQTVESRMRERYRRYEQDEEQDRATAGYSFDDYRTQHRHWTRVEFMLDDLFHDMAKGQANNPPQREKPEATWARWQEHETKLGRRPWSLEKLHAAVIEEQNQEAFKSLNQVLARNAPANRDRER